MNREGGKTQRSEAATKLGRPEFNHRGHKDHRERTDKDFYKKGRNYFLTARKNLLKLQSFWSWHCGELTATEPHKKLFVFGKVLHAGCFRFF